MDWHYIDLSGQTIGPIDEMELIALMDSGVLTAESWVFREGFDDWMTIGSSPLSHHFKKPKAALKSSDTKPKPASSQKEISKPEKKSGFLKGIIVGFLLCFAILSSLYFGTDVIVNARASIEDQVVEPERLGVQEIFESSEEGTKIQAVDEVEIVSNEVAPPSDDEMKFAKLLESAEAGNVDAQHEVGECYYFGKLQKNDFTKAAEWCLKAAENGHANAQTNIAAMLVAGQGVEKNIEEAVKWVKRSVEQGFAKGEACMGSLYEKGLGVPLDYELALSYYEISASKGYLKSQLTLGEMYLKGRGVAKDLSKAAGWYGKAAVAGDLDAQNAFGTMLLRGMGVTRNEAEGLKWMKSAAEAGHPTAILNLKKLQENQLN